MTFKKLIGKIHLWLGLSAGLVVFIVAITGCLYAFQTELQNITQPYRFVKPENKTLLLPSRIKQIADSAMPGKQTHAVLYAGKDRAIQAMFYKYEEYYDLVFINPYSGQVLQVKDMKHSFFPWILEGHEFLWLPEEMGKLVVSTATLVFFLLLCSGIYLWWPRHKNGRRQRFTIKWKARWRRKNYDLHNVPGFYAFTIGIFFALTGLIFGFEWFANGAYFTASGGKTMIPYFDPGSDTTAMHATTVPAIDQVWLRMQKEYPTAEALQLYIPKTNTAAIDASANPDVFTYWKIDYRYFDQHTLQEIPSKHLWKKLGQANGGDLLMRMAYDIHVGAIWGLPGKFLAFFASLIIASLPITGFFIWWGRNHKKKRSLTIPL
jgi:uncharacterized iron-regulated membrane protein